MKTMTRDPEQSLLARNRKPLLTVEEERRFIVEYRTLELRLLSVIFSYRQGYKIFSRRLLRSRIVLGKTCGPEVVKAVEEKRFEEISSEIHDFCRNTSRGRSWFEWAIRFAGRETDSSKRRAWGKNVSKVHCKVLAVRNHIIASNIGLIGMMATQMVRRAQHLALADLVQEGTTGLVKALERFDVEKGVRFSTYATWWIRHALQRSLENHDRIVRIPVHVAASAQTLRRAIAELGPEVSPDDIAALSQKTGFSEHKLRRAQRAMVQGSPAFSLDEPLGEDSSGSRVDTLVPEDPVTGFEEVLNVQLSTNMGAALDGLTPTERDIIVRRFGLGEHEEQTLKEIGDHYGLSRERIRQIEAVAKSKLQKHPILRQHM